MGLLSFSASGCNRWVHVGLTEAYVCHRQHRVGPGFPGVCAADRSKPDPRMPSQKAHAGVIPLRFSHVRGVTRLGTWRLTEADHFTLPRGFAGALRTNSERMGRALKPGRELFTEAPVNKNLPLFLCLLIRN
jgi:hypothetical protein